MNDDNNIIKKRNVIVGALLTVITFGFYVIYWFVQTKKEINNLGGKIPTSWLIIIPFVNFYWIYKYCEQYSKIIEKKERGFLYFILSWIFFPIFAILVQLSLNNFEEGSSNIEETRAQTKEILSQNEQTSKEYIEQYKTQYSKEAIKTQLVNAGISSEEVDTYLSKYF